MHKSVITKVYVLSDGVLAVHARCCGDASTESVLSLHGVDRSGAELDQDIQKHLVRVEKLHADREHAKAHIERLMGK